LFNSNKNPFILKDEKSLTIFFERNLPLQQFISLKKGQADKTNWFPK